MPIQDRGILPTRLFADPVSLPEQPDSPLSTLATSVPEAGELHGAIKEREEAKGDHLPREVARLGASCMERVGSQNGPRGVDCQIRKGC